MRKKLWFLCLKPNHQATNCEKNFTCFKCKTQHLVGIYYNPKESDKNDKRVDSDDEKRKVEDKTKKDDKNVSKAGIVTLNLCQKIQCF